MKKKLLTSLLFTGALFLLFASLEALDSHHVHPRYILWKMGVWSYNDPLVKHFFGVDLDFRNHLIGKTKDELISQFPTLKPNDPDKNYPIPHEIVDKDCLWFGEPGWGWALIFEKNKLVGYCISKG